MIILNYNKHIYNRLRLRRIIIALLLSLLAHAMAFGQHKVACHQLNGGFYSLYFEGLNSENDEYEWAFRFISSDEYMWGQFITTSTEPFDFISPTDNSLEFTFKTIPETKLTLHCSPNADHPEDTFDFSLWTGLVRPMNINDADITLTDKAGFNMMYLTRHLISEIRFNGVLLPGPYPARQDFKALFDTAARHVPGNDDLSQYLAFYKKAENMFSIAEADAAKNDSNKGSTKTTTVPLTTSNRPAEIPAAIEIVKGNQLYSDCIYKNYNCPLLKKSADVKPVPRTATFAQLLANPLSLNGMTWCNNAPQMLREADATGLPLWGYFQHRDDNGWVVTKIELPSLQLSDSFRYEDYEIGLAAKKYFPSARILSTDPRRIPSMSTYIEFNPYCKGTASLGSLSKGEMKKFNKKFQEFFESFMAGLQRQGYNFTKYKNPLSTQHYHMTTPDGKSCDIKLQLWTVGSIEDEHIAISIVNP